MRLQTFRERLTLLLISLLPLHALLVTVGTKILNGPGHAPLSTLALWKESLLVIILFVAAVEMLRHFRQLFTFDVLDVLIGVLIVVAVIVTATTHQDWRLFILGFRYDFVALIAFLVLRRVEWSQDFKQSAQNVLLVVGATIAAYGLITILLPTEFFTRLGYSALHSLYIPGGPVAAFQQIGSSALRRIQSTMSGPNQLGLWLLLPFSVFGVHAAAGSFYIFTRNTAKRWLLYMGYAAVILAIVFTFSRSAWIASTAIVLVLLWKYVEGQNLKKMAIQIGAPLLVVGALIVILFPNVVLRTASTNEHFVRPIEAVKVMFKNPLGQGLGTAGPASNRVSDACVYLPTDGDASWAVSQPDLCVFLGDVQAQPVGRICNCPFLPENWYLQIGVELGWLGMALYIALVAIVLIRLGRSRESTFNQVVFLSVFGVSIAALVLHAWEDSALAYTLWILVATALPHRRTQLSPSLI